MGLKKYTIDVYWKDMKVSTICVENENVRFVNYVDFPIYLPFGVRQEASYKDLLEFYEDRCFPRERANCRDLLHKLGLEEYEPESIVRETHGLQFDDFMWLQFSDEVQVEWEDIKLRD